jgi:lipopolysaccharide export system permease protein
VKLIDQYILRKFLGNFVVLFLLLFVFAAAIDLIVNLDRFVEAARKIAGDDAGSVAVSMRFLQLVFNFQGPRIFQFYAFLHGIVAVGAMGFTLAQMFRAKELVAILASGVSLHRVAMPFVAECFC